MKNPIKAIMNWDNDTFLNEVAEKFKPNPKSETPIFDELLFKHFEVYGDVETLIAEVNKYLKEEEDGHKVQVVAGGGDFFVAWEQIMKEPK